MCECIEQTNKALREHNGTLPLVMFYDGKADRVLLPSKRLNPHKRKAPPNTYPSYCPFCGEKYDG